jgi:23S rRNA (pseudouridine1915-N3)-methyltransferase
MRLHILAVGTRLPGWAAQAYAEFVRRMPRESAPLLTEVKAETRTGGKPVAALLAAEAQRIRQALPARCRLVVLDEHGEDLTTRALAERLRRWQAAGEHVALVLGGPDGLAPDIKAAAAETLRLSSLTLPHALARVLLAEALYRATSLDRNHPYHRD